METDGVTLYVISGFPVKMGKEAAKIVIKLLQQEDPERRPIQTLLRPTLVIRHSTGPVSR